MYCSSCGEELNEKNVFCSKCGKNLKGAPVDEKRDNWEYTIYRAWLNTDSHGKKGALAQVYFDFADIWNVKDSDGKTVYNELNEYGLKGWELVSTMCLPVSPTTNSIYQLQIIFLFKKRLLS